MKVTRFFVRHGKVKEIQPPVPVFIGAEFAPVSAKEPLPQRGRSIINVVPYEERKRGAVISQQSI